MVLIAGTRSSQLIPQTLYFFPNQSSAFFFAFFFFPAFFVMPFADILAHIRSIYSVNIDDGDEYLSNNWFIITVSRLSIWIVYMNWPSLWITSLLQYQAVTISTLNHPEDIQQLVALIEQDLEDMKNLTAEEKLILKVRVVAKLRDAILKGFIAGGFPKVKQKKNWTRLKFVAMVWNWTILLLWIL